MTKLKIPTREERRQAGKALREKCPRVSHGKVVLGHGEKRDVVALLKASNEGRLENLIPVRHGRMLQSPFAFFRGSAAIQAYDLDRDAGERDRRPGLRRLPPDELRRLRDARANPRLRHQRLRRDPARSVRVGSEAARRELRRRGALARIPAGSGEGDRGPGRRVLSGVDAKRAGTGVLEGWYSRITFDDVLELAGKDAALIGRVRKKIAEAREQTHEHVFHKLTSPVRGLPRIVDQPPLIFHRMGERDRPSTTRGVLQALSPDPAGGTAHPVRSLRAGRLRVEGRGRRQRRNALLRRALPGGSRRRLVPPGQGGTPLGARAVHPARARARTTASASWSGSA